MAIVVSLWPTQGRAQEPGLWGGRARIIAAAPLGSDAPTVGQSEFFLRLLIHLSADGSVRLLDRAVLVYPEGAAPRLYSRAPDALPEAGDLRRLTAPGFSLPGGALRLTGSLAEGARLEGRWTLGTDAADHPLRQAGHPNHAAPPPITRSLRLTTTQIMADGELRGRYEETIAGLTAAPLATQGFFRLRPLAPIVELSQ